MNAAHVIDIEERRRTARNGQDGAEIVAVILSDGSVRDLSRGQTDRPDDDFEAGQLDGRGWTLWWQRRSW